MTEAFYAIVIIAFASLSVLTLFTHLMRGGDLKEEVGEQRRQLELAEERIGELRAELQKLKFDTDLLDAERVALEAQGKCMIDLEASYRKQLAADERGGRR
ncbi:MAG: hypothetical protein ABIL09_17300 [Gemmatimonadota bacterium]